MGHTISLCFRYKCGRVQCRDVIFNQAEGLGNPITLVDRVLLSLLPHPASQIVGPPTCLITLERHIWSTGDAITAGERVTLHLAQQQELPQLPLLSLSKQSCTALRILQPSSSFSATFDLPHRFHPAFEIVESKLCSDPYPLLTLLWHLPRQGFCAKQRQRQSSSC